MTDLVLSELEHDFELPRFKTSAWVCIIIVKEMGGIGKVNHMACIVDLTCHNTYYFVKLAVIIILVVETLATAALWVEASSRLSHTSSK